MLKKKGKSIKTRNFPTFSTFSLLRLHLHTQPSSSFPPTVLEWKMLAAWWLYIRPKNLYAHFYLCVCWQCSLSCLPNKMILRFYLAMAQFSHINSSSKPPHSDIFPTIFWLIHFNSCRNIQGKMEVIVWKYLFSPTEERIENDWCLFIPLLHCIQNFYSWVILLIHYCITL